MDREELKDKIEVIIQSMRYYDLSPEEVAEKILQEIEKEKKSLGNCTR